MTYPGIYIEEFSSGGRTITGVATSITAFVGSALRGPLDTPVRVRAFIDFDRAFGGVSRAHPMSYAVRQFFGNGGTDALVVRVANNAAFATCSADTLNLAAANPGDWGESLRVRVDHDTRPMIGAEELFNLTVRDSVSGTTERFRDVSVLPTHPRFIGTALQQDSTLVRLQEPAPAARPSATPDAAIGLDALTVSPGSLAFNADGDDGDTITDADISAPALQSAQRGLWALEQESLFNLLCIPPLALDAAGDIGAQTRSAAAVYCRQRRAIFIADPLFEWDEPSDLISGANNLDSPTWGLARSENVALYFPRIIAPDPLQAGQPSAFAPSGSVAGVIARTDAERGVWKAPSGRGATLRGVSDLTARLSNIQNGALNPLGVNCLRTFPTTGTAVWGARTQYGVDSLASEWKYLPVRRLALFIEESLARGTQWAVFEPNDEPLWIQLRSSIDTFMLALFQQGALQGTTPRDAFFVKCDRSTMTQADIDSGVVNIIVGFAPLRPAEFVIIKLQQIAGQSER